MSEIILKTENLGISFGGLKAVQNVNIEIKKKYNSDRDGPNAVIDNSEFINSNVTSNFGNITLSKNTFVNGCVANSATIKSQVYLIVPEYSQQNGNTDQKCGQKTLWLLVVPVRLLGGFVAIGIHIFPP